MSEIQAKRNTPPALNKTVDIMESAGRIFCIDSEAELTLLTKEYKRSLDPGNLAILSNTYSGETRMFVWISETIMWQEIKNSSSIKVVDNVYQMNALNGNENTLGSFCYVKDVAKTFQYIKIDNGLHWVECSLFGKMPDNMAVLSLLSESSSGKLLYNGMPIATEGSGGTGGTGTTVYTNSNPVPIAIGGITAGETFNEVPITDVITELLYPYQAPSFFSFNMIGVSSVIEVGDSVPANRTFQWGATNNQNIKTSTVSILDITNNTTLKSNIDNDAQESVILAAISKTVATNHTFRIQAINSKNTTFSRDFSINWQFKRYRGESVLTSLVQSDIKSLRANEFANGYSGTYAFNGGGYKYIAYPSSFGTATVFKDVSTNLSVPMLPVSVVSVTNQFGISVNYNVHRTTNILGGAITISVS